MWNNTVEAEAKLFSSPITPAQTANPAASAEPTNPGAAGSRKVSAKSALPKISSINPSLVIPREIKIKYQTEPSEMKVRIDKSTSPVSLTGETSNTSKPSIIDVLN